MERAKLFLIDIFVGILDIVREVFETATPAVFAVLAAILPYFSPVPIAVYTAGHAQTYFGFNPQIAGVFVFVLEGLGVWATTTLVDAVVDFIRSRNGKTVFMVLFLGTVVVVYVVILVNLNVSLQTNIDAKLARVITLMCFIPMLSGVMNGVWKLRLEHKTETQKVKDLEESHYQQRQDELNRRWRLKHGFQEEVTQVTYALDEKVTPTYAGNYGKGMRKSVTWANSEGKLRKDKDFILNASVNDVRKRYGVSRKTVTNWRNNLNA